MDSLLLISSVVLWVLVLVLCGLVYALARQVGVLYRRVAPAGALAVNSQLAVGDTAPRLDVETLDGQPLVLGGVPEGKRGLLLFFVDPDCPICKLLLPVLESVTKDEKWLDVVLASDGGDLATHRAFVDTRNLNLYPYVVSEMLGRSYGVGKLPYAVLIDPTGRIASLGIVNSREHLESLFVAWEQQVGSLQEYMARQQLDVDAYDVATVATRGLPR